ncbi:hypothetical protein A6A29_06255 [Streptomyces sp. TSRI0281]|nr:hypothetical protein A6A29_06255 [Streptomyces sp. TSRI0281]
MPSRADSGPRGRVRAVATVYAPVPSQGISAVAREQVSTPPSTTSALKPRPLGFQATMNSPSRAQPRQG